MDSLPEVDRKHVRSSFVLLSVDLAVEFSATVIVSLSDRPSVMIFDKPSLLLVSISSRYEVGVLVLVVVVLSLRRIGAIVCCFNRILLYSKSVNTKFNRSSAFV